MHLHSIHLRKPKARKNNLVTLLPVLPLWLLCSVGVWLPSEWPLDAVLLSTGLALLVLLPLGYLLESKC